MTTTRTFQCAVSPNDTLTAVKDSDRLICIEVSSRIADNSVMLTYEQVKGLRKVLKKCLKPMGQTK